VRACKTASLNREFFGRRKGRGTHQCDSRVIAGADFVEMGRRAKDKFKTGVRIFEPLQFHLNVRFFLRLFILRNFFAEAAGMFAIERALNGSLPGSGVEILSQHGSPRHRLKRQPMSARCRERGGNHQHLAKLVEHASIFGERFTAVNLSWAVPLKD
jgi:hypothetical protein